MPRLLSVRGPLTDFNEIIFQLFTLHSDHAVPFVHPLSKKIWELFGNAEQVIFLQVLFLAKFIYFICVLWTLPYWARADHVLPLFPMNLWRTKINKAYEILRSHVFDVTNRKCFIIIDVSGRLKHCYENCYLQIPMLLIVMLNGRIGVQNRSAGLEKSIWFESVVFCPGLFLKPVEEFRGFSSLLCSHVDMYTKKAKWKSRIFRRNSRDSKTRFPACLNKLLGELGRCSFYFYRCKHWHVLIVSPRSACTGV